MNNINVIYGINGPVVTVKDTKMFSMMENSQDLVLGSMTLHVNQTARLILKDVIVGKSFDSLDSIIRDHKSSGDGIVRMYDAFQYLKDAIMS